MTHEAESAIKQVISDRGPITFAEFMQIALYGPGGYYTSGSPVRASGDFFTAPSAHPLFGALIAVQLRQMWQTLGSPCSFTVVEEGAGNGGLAADITEATSALDPQFNSALDYKALDIAPPANQHYPVSPLSETPGGVTGCVLSNELLDALPVHRFEVRSGELFEIFVSLESGRLAEVLHQPSTPLITERLGPYLDALPDGYRGEVNADLGAWAKRQASMLERGWTLIIDYGFDRQTLYKPGRSAGSLRTYYQHTLGQDPLFHAGRQDITAHVDFTAVDEELRSAGLSSEGNVTQSEFLRSLGIDEAITRIRAASLPRTALRANEAGLQVLVDPEGMGSFVVAAYSRKVPANWLTGLSHRTPATSLQLPELPLLNHRRHINLTGAQEPGRGYFEVESFEHLFSGDS